jgi:oligopeptide transport system ATP-binding protein
MTNHVLQLDNLHVQFKTDDGLVQAVNGVSFDLREGETLGIVGESGSGKSVTNLALMGLVPQPPGRVTSGKALFRGRDLLQMNQRDLAKIRGKSVAMIFQDPMTSLNPFLTIEEQLTEVTELHLGYTHKQAVQHAIEMLEMVGIPAAGDRIRDYPHQFSGGMRQRVMIAMALSCKPDVLIADEPTTALDVTIQAQILELMKQLQRDQGMSIILITHDLGVVANICHRVMVMYAGKIVEQADTDSLFDSPRHPYTLGLLNSLPRWDAGESQMLKAIEGQPPDMTKIPSGCAFHPRCPYRIDRCEQETPPLFDRPEGGHFACFVDVQKEKRPAAV